MMALFYSAGGYQFSKHFALEGGYTHFPNVKAGRTVVEKSDTKIYAAGKGIIPFNNNLNLFAKAGAAHVSTTYVAGVEDENGSSLEGTHSKVLPYEGEQGLDILFHTMSVLIYNLLVPPKSNNVPVMYAVMGGVSYQF